MKGAHTQHAKGEKHYRWNQGKMVSSHGYVKIRVGRGHPLADPNGYAYEHLLVWTNAGNARPEPGFILHHINHNKQDNRIENLQLLSRNSHADEHTDMLSDDDVRSIRNAYRDGATGTGLAKRYQIATGSLYKLLKGERRKLAGGPIFPGNLRDRKSVGNRVLGGIEQQEPTQ